jgi:hypothetical protein
MMLVCVDPAAETCAPEEDNIDEWVGEMDRRKVRVLGNRLTGVDAATVLVTDGPLAETVAGIYADGAKTREWMGAAYQKSSDRANTAEREWQRTARHRTSAGVSSWLSSRASDGTGVATLHLLGGASAPASHEAERGCERSGGRQRVDQHDPDATQERTDHQQEGLRRCRQTTLPPSRRQYSADDRTPARSGE